MMHDREKMKTEHTGCSPSLEICSTKIMPARHLPSILPRTIFNSLS